MVLPYNNNVPQGPQTIASTQQPILQNFQSIGSAFSEAGNNFSKYHMQAPSATNPVTAVNEGAIFLKTSNTKTELFYERDTGTAGAPSIPLSHLSMFRAWASFNGTAATPIIPANRLNVTKIDRTATGIFLVTLAPNAVVSADFGVICSCTTNGNNGRMCNYRSILFPAPVATFEIFIDTAFNPVSVSFMVFQL